MGGEIKAISMKKRTDNGVGKLIGADGSPGKPPDKNCEQYAISRTEDRAESRCCKDSSAIILNFF